MRSAPRCVPDSGSVRCRCRPPCPAASGALVRVLPDYRLQKLTVYTLYASRQYLDAKIRTFVDFLRECVPELLAADEAALAASCKS